MLRILTLHFDGLNVDHMMDSVKKKIPESPQYDGGATIIDRLKMVFGVSSRPQLADYIGFSTGSMSTWQTRNTTPFEVICRVSLSTGARLEWLLFGRGEMYEEQQSAKIGINLLRTENGKVLSEEELKLQELDSLKPDDGEGLSIEIDNRIYFIDPNKNDPTISGDYLICINDIHKIGELRLLPDGKIYLFEQNDRFPVDLEVTKVIGRVTGMLVRY